MAYEPEDRRPRTARAATGLGDRPDRTAPRAPRRRQPEPRTKTRDDGRWPRSATTRRAGRRPAALDIAEEAAGAAGRGQRQHPGADRHDRRDHPGRDDRRGRPRHARHDPQGVRLGLCVVLDGRPGGERAGLLAGIGPGRRRVPAADAHGAVPRGRGAQRPGLAACATCSTSPTSASCTTAAARPLAQPRRDPDGRRPAGDARRPGRRHARLLLDQDAGDLRRRGSSALRTIGRLASDKFSKLARQGELTRIKQMIENAPVNIMYADRDLKLLYMNPASSRRSSGSSRTCRSRSTR